MEWRKIKVKDHEGYALIDKNKNLATIALASKKSSFKASLHIEKETYKIRRKGFWKSVIVIVNDKDEVVVRAGHEKLHYGKGIIEIKSSKYYYKFVNTPLAELMLFEKETSPLISYKLSVKNKTIAVDLVTSSQVNKLKDKSLLLSIGWYMFQPIVKENVITKWV